MAGVGRDEPGRRGQGAWRRLMRSVGSCGSRSSLDVKEDEEYFLIRRDIATVETSLLSFAREFLSSIVPDSHRRFVAT